MEPRKRGSVHSERRIVDRNGSSLPKIPALYGIRRGGQGGLKEAFDDEVDHAVFGLDFSLYAEERGGLGEDFVFLEDVFPDDQIGEAGFVLQGHEGDAGGGGGALATDDHAGVAHSSAVFLSAEILGGEQPHFLELGTQRAQGMAEGGVARCGKVPAHGFELGEAPKLGGRPARR